MPSPAAVERNRVASRLRYYTSGRADNRGPWGGARKCRPGCTCKRHGSLMRAKVAKVEWEGEVARIHCPKCNRRIAGVFTEEEVKALLGAHRHRVRNLPTRGRQMEIE